MFDADDNLWIVDWTTQEAHRWNAATLSGALGDAGSIAPDATLSGPALVGPIAINWMRNGTPFITNYGDQTIAFFDATDIEATGTPTPSKVLSMFSDVAALRTASTARRVRPETRLARPCSMALDDAPLARSQKFWFVKSTTILWRTSEVASTGEMPYVNLRLRRPRPTPSPSALVARPSLLQAGP